MSAKTIPSERVCAYRARKKEQPQGQETEDTPASRHVTPRNAPDQIRSDQTEAVSRSEKSRHTQEQILLCVRGPRAADMNGTVSQRFDEFCGLYPRKQRKDSACQAWLNVATTENGDCGV